MNLFTVDLKNQPGELAHLCETLAQRNINLDLGGVTAGDHGFVYFIASDEAAARGGLEAGHIGYAEHPALKVKCADRPGEAAAIGRKLADAGVNIEVLLPVSICGGEVVFALSVDKPEDARRVLGDQLVG